MIYSGNTHLLFPPSAIASLRNARGPLWQELVDHVLQAPSDSTEQAAFLLVMARLNGCTTCNIDSYRALQGCPACARQSLRRFRGSDEELQDLYQTAIQEVTRFLNQKTSNPPPTKMAEE